MTPTEAAALLRQYNQWRRGNLEGQPQPDPRKIGEAIEVAIAMIDRLEGAESDALEQARLNGMGASREAALMAKLEAAEKSDAESLAMYRKARDKRPRKNATPCAPRSRRWSGRSLLRGVPLTKLKLSSRRLG